VESQDSVQGKKRSRKLFNASDFSIDIRSKRKPEQSEREPKEKDKTKKAKLNFFRKMIFNPAKKFVVPRLARK